MEEWTPLDFLPKNKTISGLSYWEISENYLSPLALSNLDHAPATAAESQLMLGILFFTVLQSRT